MGEWRRTGSRTTASLRTFARAEPRRTRVFRDAHRLGLHERRAAHGRHHRAPHPALPPAPHQRARALRRLLRRVQLRCREHSRPAAGPACRATRRSQPGRPMRLQRLVHFGTPANEERRTLRVSRITDAAKESSESARATRPVRLPQCGHRARVPAASRVPTAAAAVLSEVRVPLVPN